MRIVAQEKEKNTTKIKTTGKQIQSIADLLCGIGCFICIVSGIFFSPTKYIMLAVIVIAVGCYVAWASTRILKGFGELVDNTEANRANTDRILFALESIQKTLQTNIQQNEKEPEA